MSELILKEFGAKPIRILYELSYWYIFEDYTEDIRRLGVYSSHEKAMNALSRAQNDEEIRKLPQGGRMMEEDYPQGLCIYECYLDVVSWSEGFVSGDFD